nr:ABC transporter substrate-binding protein [Actinomycetales bacterium]
SSEEPGANVTGTSDMSPVQEQLELILELDPSVETIGIVFSSKEDNSYVQSAWAEDIAKEMGLTIETATVAESADIKSAAESLDVDAYYVLTDNMVVAGVESIIEVAEARGVSVVTSDAGSVERGALASYAFDYYDMGVQSGKMALRILEGTAPADIPVETSEKIYLTLNPDAAERMGVTIPQSVLDRADEIVE